MRRSRAGYTLIELMVVVAIVSVLISLALPAFRNYVMRARAAEAPTFMGEIRLREEAYRTEFYQYAAVTWNPTAIPPNGDPVHFDDLVADWRALGALPDSPVRFRYSVAVGTPGTPPTPCGGAVPGVGGTDFAFVMEAEGDLDGNGTAMGVEGYSESSLLYYSVNGCGGPPLASGWN